MGLFDSITGLFDSATTDISSSLDIGQSLLGGPDAGSGNYSIPVSYPGYGVLAQAPMQPPVMAMPVGNRDLVARARAAGLPSWSAKFPSLWQIIQTYKGNGILMTAEKLVGLLARFGPSMLAIMIGAQAVSELMAYKVTHKRRRMNPANTRALRRSLRRLKSFDKLAHRVQGQLHRGGRRRAAPARCGSCRKSPCAC